MKEEQWVSGWTVVSAPTHLLPERTVNIGSVARLAVDACFPVTLYVFYLTNAPVRMSCTSAIPTL